MEFLRAYQEMHNNFFEEVEELAEKFALEQKWTRLSPPTREELIGTLHQLHSVDARVADFSKYPELTDQKFIFLPSKPSQLFLNNRHVPSQHVYSLALQIGYSELKIRKRPRNSLRKQFDSFEQVMDNILSSYFAGALMINRKQVKEELKEIFQSETWNSDAILEFLKHHEVNPETFLHRLSQILPGLFNSQNYSIFVLNILLE